MKIVNLQTKMMDLHLKVNNELVKNVTKEVFRNFFNTQNAWKITFFCLYFEKKCSKKLTVSWYGCGETDVENDQKQNWITTWRKYINELTMAEAERKLQDHRIG